MTIYEHAMLGINGALALGLQRRHGWPLVAMAGLAAVLPDVDGLALVLGPTCYAAGHRVWTHGLLSAGVAAAIAAAVVYAWDIFTRVQRRLARWGVLPVEATPARCESNTLLESDAAIGPRCGRELLLWICVSVVAAYSHLLTDIFFSGGRGQPLWGVPIGWPFSNAVQACPLVPWGDVGVTAVFAAGTFAMLRWRTRTQTIAAGTLCLVAIYVAGRGVFS
ncbi:MAG: metal-dependent hydrolase [Thermoguttaceae bacterium]